MKIRLVFLLVCVVACNACSEREKHNSDRVAKDRDLKIYVEDLNERVVVGVLGVPLGEPVEIIATIFDGDLMTDKINSGSYFLEVTHVNGDKLNDSIILDFSLEHASGVELARNNFDLYFIKHEKNAGELTDDQIATLKKEYVDKTVTLLVYETGEFTGMPSNLPDDTDLWQSGGFCFKSKLEVLLNK